MFLRKCEKTREMQSFFSYRVDLDPMTLKRAELRFVPDCNLVFLIAFVGLILTLLVIYYL